MTKKEALKSLDKFRKRLHDYKDWSGITIKDFQPMIGVLEYLIKRRDRRKP